MRLRHLFTGELSWRELGVYVEHLPLESATQTARLAAMSDADYAAAARESYTHGAWSHTDLLVAGVYDAIERLIFVQLRRAGVESAKAPEPIRRPGVRDKSNVRALSPAAVAYLNTKRAPRGA